MPDVEICIQDAVEILQDPIWQEYMEPSSWFKACRGDVGARESLIRQSESWFSVAERCDEKVIWWAGYSNALYCCAIKFNRKETKLGKREGESQHMLILRLSLKLSLLSAATLAKRINGITDGFLAWDPETAKLSVVGEPRVTTWEEELIHIGARYME